ARAETITKILAVPVPTVDELAAGAVVPSLGTRRRLQALATLGWSIDQLVQHTGLRDRQPLDRAIHGDTTSAGTARAIRDLYEQLWNTPPVPGNRFEQSTVTRTRNTATKNGWPPPAAWDDPDNPDEQPTAAPAGRGIDLDDAA